MTASLQSLGISSQEVFPSPLGRGELSQGPPGRNTSLAPLVIGAFSVKTQGLTPSLSFPRKCPDWTRPSLLSSFVLVFRV